MDLSCQPHQLADTLTGFFAKGPPSGSLKYGLLLFPVPKLWYPPWSLSSLPQKLLISQALLDPRTL